MQLAVVKFVSTMKAPGTTITMRFEHRCHHMQQHALTYVCTMHDSHQQTWMCCYPASCGQALVSMRMLPHNLFSYAAELYLARCCKLPCFNTLGTQKHTMRSSSPDYQALLACLQSGAQRVFCTPQYDCCCFEEACSRSGSLPGVAAHMQVLVTVSHGHWSTVLQSI